MSEFICLHRADKRDPATGPGKPEHERMLGGGSGFGFHPSGIPQHRAEERRQRHSSHDLQPGGVPQGNAIALHPAGFHSAQLSRVNLVSSAVVGGLLDSE